MLFRSVGTGMDDLQYKFDVRYEEYVKLDTNALDGLALDVQIDFNATAEALFGTVEETE